MTQIKWKLVYPFLNCNEITDKYQFLHLQFTFNHIYIAYIYGNSISGYWYLIKNNLNNHIIIDTMKSKNMKLKNVINECTDSINKLTSTYMFPEIYHKNENDKYYNKNL